MNKQNIPVSANLFFLVLVLSSCAKPHTEKYHTVLDKIDAESRHYQDPSISSKAYLQEEKMIEISEDGYIFLIPERKIHITSYACSECHSVPLRKLKSDGVARKAHWDIHLVHADENTMNCFTCHKSSDMNRLVSLTGKDIDFDASYRLCSQCHTKQFEDWKGGAHGKRLGGWTPPRAAMTCVNCHNPHDPSFKPRWPSVFNTRKIKERK